MFVIGMDSKVGEKYLGLGDGQRERGGEKEDGDEHTWNGMTATTPLTPERNKTRTQMYLRHLFSILVKVSRVKKIHSQVLDDGELQYHLCNLPSNTMWKK